MEDRDRIAQDYRPAALIDFVKKRLQLRSDAQLAQFLEVGSPLISKVRHGHDALSAALLIRIHEACGMEVAEMRRVCGDRRLKYRV